MAQSKSKQSKQKGSGPSDDPTLRNPTPHITNTIRKSSTSAIAAVKQWPNKSEWPVPPNTPKPPNDTVDGKDVSKLKAGLEDVSVDQLDGANAVFRIGNEARLVSQADLHRVAKQFARAIQNTY